MARLATLVANYLKTKPGITGIASTRVLDFDYRGAGWNTAPVQVLDSLGLMRPTIVVDETGATKPLFSRAIHGEEQAVYIRVFGPRTAAGANDVDLLMKRSKTILQQWQEPTTKGIFIWTDREGPLVAEDGVFGAEVFRVAGVPPREE